MSQDDKDQAIVDFYHSIAMTHRRPEGPKPTGSCHFCDAPVKTGDRWCDRYCREDWERQEGRHNVAPRR